MKTTTSYLDKLGLADVQHTHDDLLAHLVGVYNYLDEWDMPAKISNAGLFHSVYGTEGFPTPSLAHDRRNELRDLIGKESEQLVYWYCAMSYESLQESVDEGKALLRNRFTDEVITTSENEFEYILWIKLADAFEQADESTSGRRFFRRVAELLGPEGVKRWDEKFL